MFNFASRKPAGPVGAKGWRAYDVGDIHGRLDLLDQLLDKIHADLTRRPARKVLLVFVGDLIDRGPASAQVVERLRTYSHPGVQTMFLLGNHEEVLLRVIQGEADLIAKWCTFGGTECLKSYGVDTSKLAAMDDQEALGAIRKAIPKSHVEFLEDCHDSCRFGDYLFVHAGIRPGVEIDQQKQSDLRWIREPFLFDETDHGFVVVHGHTIRPDVEVLPNRIGIDTGAYRSGVLTALAIEGAETWFLDTRSDVRQAESSPAAPSSPRPCAQSRTSCRSARAWARLRMSMRFTSSRHR
ncbi:MAG TPA: metallophosphoesterase [Sphingomicrobium sp.]|jgi:serine/threonine protein phosphatase 1